MMAGLSNESRPGVLMAGPSNESHPGPNVTMAGLSNESCPEVAMTPVICTKCLETFSCKGNLRATQI